MDESDRLSKKAWNIFATTYILAFILYFIAFTVDGIPFPLNSNQYFSMGPFLAVSGLLILFGSIISILLFLKSRRIKPTDSNSSGLKSVISLFLLFTAFVLMGFSIAISGL
jgi:hypothetical protein